MSAPTLSELSARLGGGKTVDSGMCRVVRRFVVRCNDSWSYENRQKLLAIIPLLVGSHADREVEVKRAYVFADFAVRKALAFLCEKLGYAAECEQLRALKPMIDRSTAEEVRQAARSVREFFRGKHAYAAASYAATAAATAAAYAADAYPYAHAMNSDDAYAYAADADAYAYAALAAADAASGRRSLAEFADLAIEAIKAALAVVE